MVLWESVASALDYTGDMPYAWGISSLLRGASPELLSGGVGSAAASITGWLARAAADAFFIPVDECSGLLLAVRSATESSPTPTPLSSQPPPMPLGEAILSCARGWSFFYFIFIDRFELGMAIDDAVGFLVSAAGDVGLGGDPRKTPLHLLKILAALTCPWEGAGYFVDVQLEAAWDWVLDLSSLYG